MAKLKVKSNRTRFEQINVWSETAERLKASAKKRDETLAQYIDNLSKI